VRPSRKSLAAKAADQGARIDKLTAERDGFKSQALANITALRLISRELSDLKDEVALHIELARLEGSQL
jgi:hypothetical protein